MGISGVGVEGRFHVLDQGDVGRAIEKGKTPPLARAVGQESRNHITGHGIWVCAAWL